MATATLEELIGRRQWDDVVRRIELIEAGGTDHDNEIREIDSHGYLPLHQACFLQPPVVVVKALIDAYPESVTICACSPLCPKSTTSYSVSTSGGRCLGNDKTALHVLSFHGGPVDALQLLLSLHPQALEQSEALRGFFPLHCACAGTAVPSVVEALLQACPRIVQVATSRTGETPLHLVVQASDAAIESFRLIFKAYPEAAAIPAINESTTATNYYRELFGENTDAPKRGPLPLHCACRRPNPHQEIIQSLLKAHPQAAATADDMGRLPLHICCMFQDKAETARRLIEEFPQGLMVRDSFGRLPLHLAFMDTNLLDLVWALLRAYPDAMYAVKADDDDDNDEPDDLEGYSDNCDSENDMEEDENCACPSCRRRRCPFRIIDEIPISPRFRRDLHLFVRKVYPGSTQNQEYNNKNNDDDALDRNARAIGLEKVVDEASQRLPLHVACVRMAPVGIIEAMCDLFPEALNMTDAFGRLPLHCACSGGIEATAIQKSSDASKAQKQSPVGETFPQPPLSSDVIALLIERNGIALRTRDKHGMVPFHVACFSTASIEKSVGDSSRGRPMTTTSTVEALYLLLRESPDVLSSG